MAGFHENIPRRERSSKRLISLVMLILLISFETLTFASADGVETVIRGNTAVVKIPCEWLYNYAIDQNPLGTQSCSFDSRIFLADDDWLEDHLNDAFDDNVYYSDKEWLKKTLGDAEYSSFKKAYQEYGIAICLKVRDVSVICDSTSPSYDRLLLNKRCVDGSWYVIFRQDQIEFKDACVYYPTTIVGYDDEIKVIDHADQEIPDYLISKTKYDEEPDNTLDRYGYTFDIFSVLDINIVVITGSISRHGFIENAVLEIGNDVRIEINGYRQNKQVVYCCVLSDSELKALNNKEIQIVSYE